MNEKQKEYGEHADELMVQTEAAPRTSGTELLAMLIEKDAPMETLKEFMDLRDRDDAREAKRAYTKAMAEFKSDAPEIEKDAEVDFTNKEGIRTQYNHASLGNVTNTINKALGTHDLSAAWKTEQGEGSIQVTCTITHALGHSESTYLKASADNSGNKNSIQAIGSTVSYLQRYTILALTGLATKEQDDDGQGAGQEFISEDQAKEINTLLKETKADSVRFLKFVDAEEVATIPQAKFIMAKNALLKKGGK